MACHSPGATWPVRGGRAMCAHTTRQRHRTGTRQCRRLTGLTRPYSCSSRPIQYRPSTTSRCFAHTHTRCVNRGIIAIAPASTVSECVTDGGSTEPCAVRVSVCSPLTQLCAAPVHLSPAGSLLAHAPIGTHAIVHVAQALALHLRYPTPCAHADYGRWSLCTQQSAVTKRKPGVSGCSYGLQLSLWLWLF